MIVSLPPTRWIVLAGALLLVGVALVRVTACGGGGGGVGDAGTASPAPLPGPDPVAATDPAAATDTAADLANAGEETDAPPDQPVGRMQVIIYYPDSRRDGLIGESREIFRTATPADRAKQIIADLLGGPASSRAMRALPSDVALRQVFVLDDGTAWVDLTGSVKAGLRGSHEELLAVYSIVDSLALNVAEIRRVGLLLDGRPLESLGGHVDLRRPLPPDRSLIVGTIDAGSV